MLRLDLERELPCRPARAWPLVAEPELINRWSSARVESIANGDGCHPGGTGALRRVHLPRPRVTLTEIIERAEAPRRLDYRVIAGAPIRHHAGSIQVLDSSRGAILRWEIEIDFVAPGLAWLAHRALAPMLAASLDRLVALAAAPPDARPLPPLRTFDDAPDTIGALRDDLERALAAVRAQADRLLLRGDDRGHFARTLQYVIEDLGALVDNERFDHPSFVLRLAAALGRRYDAALRTRLGEGTATGAIAAHWERAFDATERGRAHGETAFEAAIGGVKAGIRALVEDDLPAALADAYREVAARSDFVRFLPDFLRTEGLVLDAAERVIADWPRRAWSPRARLLDALVPDALRARVIDRTVYPLSHAYRAAFDRAAEQIARSARVAR